MEKTITQFKTMNVMDSKSAQILADLEIAKSKGDLVQIVSILHFNQKILSKRDSRIMDVCDFNTIEKLIKSGFISNKMNREEELDNVSSYRNKLHHLIRFIDSVSRKAHLQLSFIPVKGEKLFISDDGTMMSLCFGMYRDAKKLSASEIDEILDDIQSNYDYNGNELFFNSIREWIEKLDEQQLMLKYSVQDVLRETSMIEYFNQTKINYEINIFTTKQHIKDQQNANLQPNPWIAHNFYKAPIKADDSYETTFCGDRLQNEVFMIVPGIGCDPKTQGDRLFRKYATGSKKTEKDIPFYTTMGALLVTNSLDDILKNNVMFKNYAKHEDSVYGSFWYERYSQLVKEVTYKDMQQHVTNFMLIQDNGWANIVTAINVEKQNYGVTSCNSFEDLTPFKDDFGMYITYVIMGLHKLHEKAFARTASTNIVRIKEVLIKRIIEYITADDTFNIFFQDGSRNWDARFEYVWQPAIKQTVTDMGKKAKSEKSFDREVRHQKDAIMKIVRDNDWGNVWTCFSHQSDRLIQINMNDWSKTMAGLHCVSRDAGGTAEDGVIFGLVADNGGDWKYENLNELFDRPSDYWQSLGDRNSEMLELKKNELSASDIRRIKKFIELCDVIAAEGIDYICKK